MAMVHVQRSGQLSVEHSYRAVNVQAPSAQTPKDVNSDSGGRRRGRLDDDAGVVVA
jgi:hypothetical protein